MSSIGPDPFDENSLRQANRLDALCDQFESFWKRDEPPRIEDFLLDTAPPLQATLFAELLKVDLTYRKRKGDLASLDDYASRFPAFRDLIRSVGAIHDAVAPVQSGQVQRIGSLELLQLIGTGSFGEVWKAWDTELKRVVAVKLPRERLAGPEQREHFLREARAAARLQHPGLVPVYRSGEEAGTVFIVSQFIDGTTLQESLKDGPVTPRAGAHMCLQLAKALDHAHRAGIVHRDLKPGNVLLDNSNQPHITDFGLAKYLDAASTLCSPGALVGTLAYMSPEQAGGHSDCIDPRTDLYALGVILYEMLAGQLPFEGEAAVVLKRLLREDPTPPKQLPPAVPRDLASVCLKAFAKDREDRYSTAAEFADDLQRFLDGRPVLCRRTTALHRLWRLLKRNRWLTISISVTMTSATAAIVLGLQPATLPPGEVRSVVLTTDPLDAKVTFFPLADSGEPIADQGINPSGRTSGAGQHSILLAPGDYLVVACVEGEIARFHEVYRHVPAIDEALPGNYRHQFWKQTEDGQSVELPKVSIPELSVTADMLLLQPESEVMIGKPESTTVPQFRCGIPPFFIDAVEVTVGDYKRAYRGAVPVDLRWRPVPDDHAVTIDADAAMQLAEILGKRLLHEEEYEWAAVHEEFHGTTDVATTNSPPPESNAFGPVYPAVFGPLPLSGRLYGLRSNVAEWTISRCNRYPVQSTSEVSFPDLPDYRIIRGGSAMVVDGENTVSEDSRDPSARLALPKSIVRPGLGFRCGRSARPRLRPQDFISRRSR